MTLPSKSLSCWKCKYDKLFECVICEQPSTDCTCVKPSLQCLNCGQMQEYMTNK